MSVVITQIVNGLTAATTLYDFQFTSYANIGGNYYAVGPSGFYQIDVGDTDNGAPINAVLSTGEEDFNTAQIKRLSDVYMDMRATGDIVFRVYPDETAPFEYTVSPLMVTTLRQRRSWIGKGMRARHFRFEIENTNGCNFDLNDILVSADVTARRL